MPKNSPSNPASAPDCNQPSAGAVGTCPAAQEYVFAWDQPFSHRQWVNLPNAWGTVGFGTETTLSGHVEPRAAGQVVTFTLIADPANHASATGAALQSATATSDGTGKVTVKLTFPRYPGSKFKVAGKTATMAAPVETDQITVWRRIYYQSTSMTAAPDGTVFTPPADMISALTSAFDPVWIELAPSTKSSDTTPHQEHLTAAQRNTLETSLRSGAADDRSPFKMNIVLIDKADIVAEQEWTTNTAGPAVQTPPFLRWTYEATVIRAEYERSAGVWAALTNVQVVNLPGGNAQVTATIPPPPAPPAPPAPAPAPAPAGGASPPAPSPPPAPPPPPPVNVRIKYRYQRGTAGGWGGTTGTLFMCIGRQRRANPATPTGAELQQALTHETGHALGLVATTASWIDPDPRDAGYSLRHCGYKTAAGVPRCVMWFMLGGGGDRLLFCSSNDPNDCAHFLLNADLSTIHWI